MILQRIKTLWRVSGMTLESDNNFRLSETFGAKKDFLVFKSKRGAIYEPQTDLEEQREMVLEENRAKGVDTPIKALTDYDED